MDGLFPCQTDRAGPSQFHLPNPLQLHMREIDEEDRIVIGMDTTNPNQQQKGASSYLVTIL